MLRLYGLYPKSLPAPELLLREDYAAFQQCDEEKQPASRHVRLRGTKHSNPVYAHELLPAFGQNVASSVIANAVKQYSVPDWFASLRSQ
jgi:hypothetical protein